MVKFRSAILCDEVRTEDTGKKILIGVYYETILSKTEKFRLILSYILEISGNRDTSLSFRSLLNGKVIASISDIEPFSSASAGDELFGAVELTGLRVTGEGNSELVLQFCEPGKRWREVHRARIVVKDQ